MTTDSKMLDILRKIGEAAPPPIRLSKVFQSPEQDFFSFLLPFEKPLLHARVFELLASAAINLRWVGEYASKGSVLRVQLCVDSEFREKAGALFRSLELEGAIQELHHTPRVLILSVYPFGGQPQIAERIFDTLRSRNVEILGVGTATSVFSCVIATRDLKSAIEHLKRTFVLP